MNNCSESLAAELASIPQIKLDNGLIQALVVMPDEHDNFYQGARFERAGFILTFLYNNVNYFGRNFLPLQRNPKEHDHVSGQAEEFRIPIDLDEHRFIKIGNGVFRKTPEQVGPYRFILPYETIRIFPWTVTAGPDFAEFRQSAAEEGYSYEYSKRIQLLPDTKTLRIDYQFINTGSERIVSDQYAHNFTAIDEHPMGQGYSLEFGFVPEHVRLPKRTDTITRSGNLYTVNEGNIQIECFAVPVAAEENHVIIRHASGHALEIRESTEASTYNLFMSKIAICPEAHHAIDLPSGASKMWTREYTILS